MISATFIANLLVPGLCLDPYQRHGIGRTLILVNSLEPRPRRVAPQLSCPGSGDDLAVALFEGR